MKCLSAFLKLKEALVIQEESTPHMTRSLSNCVEY